MKTNRSLMTLAGLTVMLFALGAVGAKGQGIYITEFAGKFTLPTAAQWGKMTLPVGEYTMRYGIDESGHGLVLVRGAAEGTPQGMILAGPAGDTSATKSALVCVREGEDLIVRALEMPQIGKAAGFVLPRRARLVAHNGKHGGYTHLAEAPMLIQRIPLTLKAK